MIENELSIFFLKRLILVHDIIVIKLYYSLSMMCLSFVVINCALTMEILQ